MLLVLFISNERLDLNDIRLGNAVLEGNATYPLPAPMAIPITLGFAVHLRGPRRRHARRVDLMPTG
jgi:hypothetical protein